MINMYKLNVLCLFAIILVFAACTPTTDKKQKVKKDEHSAEYALDYEGVYKGTYPCADCEGIQVTLTLGSDSLFVYETIYLGEKDGRFVDRGKYTVEENILTIQQKNEPVYFFVGESSLTLLDKDLKPSSGELADYYILKKQRAFDYIGKYETFNEEIGGYTQTLSIQENEENSYEIVFSASKVKNSENCSFLGIGHIKKDTLWVDISNEEDKEVMMYIVPSHDNLGVEVFTRDFEERYFMMRYCGGGSSLAGKYIKNIITAGSIGVFNQETTVSNLLHALPGLQVFKKAGHGEFAEDVYDDYEVYDHNANLLFTMTPKDTGDVFQKFNRVLVNSSFFKTEKGIDLNATYGDIIDAYTIDGIEPTREHIVLNINEINANFSIPKNVLKRGWWNDQTKKINRDKIPLNARVDSFILWWEE